MQEKIIYLPPYKLKNDINSARTASFIFGTLSEENSYIFNFDL